MVDINKKKMTIFKKGFYWIMFEKVLKNVYHYFSWLVGLIVLWHINLFELFNAKSILLEEQ